MNEGFTLIVVSIAVNVHEAVKKHITMLRLCKLDLYRQAGGEVKAS
jgi:hypothetical protein